MERKSYCNCLTRKFVSTNFECWFDKVLFKSVEKQWMDVWMDFNYR